MTTEIQIQPDSVLKWNLRQLYWDVFWFGILAGSTLAFTAVYAARLGASGFQIGLLSAGPAIVNLVCTFPSGRWMEGRSLIKVSFRSAIWQRLGYVVMIGLPWLVSPKAQVWGLIWITLVMSVAGTILAISFNALFAEVLPPDRRAQAVGRRNILLAISLTLSTFFSGQILDWVSFPQNYQVVFAIGAVTAMLSSHHIGRLRKPTHIEVSTPLPVPALARQRSANKLASLIRLDLIQGPFGIFMLAYLAFYAFQYFPIPLFPLAYVDRLHMTDGMIGVGTALFYGSMMVASFRLNYFSNRFGHRKLLIVSAALFPVFPLLLGMAQNEVLYFLACLLGGAVNAMLSGALVNRLMDRVPADDRPGHMTIHNMALNLGILVGSLLGPISAGLFGLQYSLLIGAGLRLLAAGFFWLWG